MKINLAVLFGGKSVEHEISVISALQAIGSMDKDKYTVFPVYLTKKNEFFYSDHLLNIEEYKNIPELLKKSMQINFVVKNDKTFMYSCKSKTIFKDKAIALIDVAFPVVHGSNTEDGTLQGYLKTLNLPLVGCDVLSAAVCMDKFNTKVMLKYADIPVLDCLRFSLEDYKEIDNIIISTQEKFKYPVIVKPINLGSSIGIGKANNKEELEKSIATAFLFTNKIIIEQAVVNLKEINCSVLGDSISAIASECEEPIPYDEILSYSDKYGGGGSKGMAGSQRKIPADISVEVKKKIQQTAVDAFKFLDCSGVARIDFLMDTNTEEIWLNEINTIPGSLSFYLWEPTGLKYTDLIDKLISLALNRQRKEEDIIYSFETNILESGSFGAKGLKN